MAPHMSQVSLSKVATILNRSTPSSVKLSFWAALEKAAASVITRRPALPLDTLNWWEMAAMALSGASPRMIIWVSWVLTLFTKACLLVQQRSRKVRLSAVQGRERTFAIVASLMACMVQPTPRPR